MKILVVGSGGREHAIIKKISESPRVKEIYAAPGNGGIADIATLVDIKADEIEKLACFVYERGIDLTIVGPEAPLAEGITEAFEERHLRIFGPSKEASRLEASKIFTKEICKKYNIPTAGFEVFDEPQKAMDYIERAEKPQVVKADGLAGGKGVVVAGDKVEAKEAVRAMMIEKQFGDAGLKVMIEERLYGEEASILVLSDGENIYPLASSQDHKQIYDEDRGPNTGGMGAYSPAPIITDTMYQRIIAEIITPTVFAMKEEGCPYKGVLYAGVMITEEGPMLLEYNVRFGDPETQAVLPRMKSDLIEAIEAVIDGRLNELKVEWDERSCVCVVLASGGYPAGYEKGKTISGLDKVKKLKDIAVYHAGTKKEDGKVYTSGGRVLGVTALDKDITGAIDKVYKAIKLISFDKMYYRTDIGQKAVKRVKS
ncbi:MAG: phosphoribosylamine--glycine ligase [Candidatus Omnitrophica bacterium]|nr:phosphoribosylamine--glycine ligase [Candidatus Omnitrophota bacterium]